MQVRLTDNGVYTYDANGNEASRSVTRTVAGTSRTETTRRTYDAEGRLTEETDASGATRRTSYNKAGKPETRTDALGRITRYTYDANARLIQTTHPDGSTESLEYDANGNETAHTDSLGRTTRKTYDALNRLTQTTHPDGSTQRTEYDAAGRVVAEIDAQGATTRHEYDAAGQLIATTDPAGARTTHTYDANGNRTTTTTPGTRPAAQRTTTHTYDALNRLTQTTYPDGSTHQVSYRPDGRKQSETDARGTTSTYGYDAKGQLTSVVQSGVARPTTYAWDEQGAKTTQTDALGRQVRWSHDTAGRPLSRSLPDGATETFQYDAEGQTVARTTFAGQHIQSTYDALGRELTRIIPAAGSTPARTITWTYDAAGRRLTQTETGQTSPGGTTTYRYDAAGRLIEQQGPQGTLTWAYDAQGRITQRSTPEGTTRYQYDAAGRLTGLTAPDGKATTYAYDAAGQNTQSVQALDANTALVTERRYDAMGRQITVAHSRRGTAGTPASTTLITGQAIQRGTGGAVSRIDTYGTGATFDATAGSFSGAPTRIQQFGYDANARLTREANFKGAELTALLANPQANPPPPATTDTRYTYDDVGNRTVKTVTTPAGTETTRYRYDLNDRLTDETLSTATGSTVQITYTWDANGNLQSKTTPSEYTGYVFDADNRLIEVRRGTSQATATTVATYGYDADGQRIRKQTPSGTTHYLIDTTTTWPQVVLERTQDPTGQATQSTAYVWGNELRQQVRGGQGTLFGSPAESLNALQGHLGTTIAAVNASGQAVEGYESSAFGEPGNATPKLKHQYTGEYWDQEVRATYLRARWYEAGSGRFVAPDLFVGVAGKPKTLARYANAENLPVSGFDPLGHMTLSELNQGIGNVVRCWRRPKTEPLLRVVPPEN